MQNDTKLNSLRMYSGGCFFIENGAVTIGYRTLHRWVKKIFNAHFSMLNFHCMSEGGARL